MAAMNLTAPFSCPGCGSTFELRMESVDFVDGTRRLNTVVFKPKQEDIDKVIMHVSDELNELLRQYRGIRDSLKEWGIVLDDVPPDMPPDLPRPQGDPWP